MRHSFSSIVLVMAASAVLCACSKEKELEYKTAEASVGDITSVITATGTIEPVTSVDVGTQVSGIVSKLYVDYNSVVKAGDVIAELDKTNLLSDLSSAKANLTSAQSNLEYQQRNHERFKSLYDKGLISANEYEQARLNYIQARQTVSQQQENVKRAQTNLGYATITSPIDGVVLSKEVEEGQTVASSFNTPTLFKIAKDLTDMRVIAKVDEADIGNVKEGQRVTFTVDAFPEDTFEGSVTQVRQQATTESNVVTYEVVIGAPNSDLKLKPGLTASVTIYTMEVKNVLHVPTKALRFTPDAEMLSKDITIADCQSAHKVWVKEGNAIKAYPIEVGMTNGMLTQVTSGLKSGTPILTDIAIKEEEPQGEEPRNPFMPHPKDKKKAK